MQRDKVLKLIEGVKDSATSKREYYYFLSEAILQLCEDEVIKERDECEKVASTSLDRMNIITHIRDRSKKLPAIAQLDIFSLRKLVYAIADVYDKYCRGLRGRDATSHPEDLPGLTDVICKSDLDKTLEIQTLNSNLQREVTEKEALLGLVDGSNTRIQLLQASMDFVSQTSTKPLASVALELTALRALRDKVLKDDFASMRERRSPEFETWKFVVGAAELARSFEDEELQGPSVEVEVLELRKRVKEAEAEVVRLKDCLEPGKANAVVNGIFNEAERLGFYKPTAKHALTQFVEEVERLRKYVDELETELVALKCQIFFDKEATDKKEQQLTTEVGKLNTLNRILFHLSKFGEHFSYCNSQEAQRGNHPIPCNCGYSDALTAYIEAKYPKTDKESHEREPISVSESA